MSTQQISLEVAGKSYDMVVPEGQEPRLQKVAENVNEILDKIRASSPSMERDRQLVMAILTVASDLLDTEQERDIEQKNIAAFHNSLAERLEKILPSS